MPNRLASLAVPISPIDEFVACAVVRDMFAADSHLSCIPVVRNGRPVGIVDRQAFRLAMADPELHARYENGPVSALMDADPLIVDIDEELWNVNRRIVDDRPDALQTGFVVTSQGVYFGVGSALSLLQFTTSHVAAQARRLEEASARAEQAIWAKSRFLADISHELRTPLNAIMGFSEVMSNELVGPLGNDRYRDYVTDIHASCRHLLALINDAFDRVGVAAERPANQPADTTVRKVRDARCA
jgi:two-component system cell cycle sensor histidine kinase PleC